MTNQKGVGAMKEEAKIAFVKANGKCCYCNAQLKIEKDDHTFIKTRGYAKYYREEKTII